MLEAAWDQVGDASRKLGRKISEGYRQLEERRPSDPNAARAEGQREGVVPTPSGGHRRTDRAFTALGDTLRDKETQGQLRDASSKLGDAVEVTFRSISEEVRRAARSRRPRTRATVPPARPKTDFHFGAKRGVRLLLTSTDPCRSGCSLWTLGIRGRIGNEDRQADIKRNANATQIPAATIAGINVESAL